uniref:TPR_REGION domain-containing protein n=1 Tax=Parastrongyloides trichosuri TaxID=131310 RepID=A0A0N4ZMG0_PARTI
MNLTDIENHKWTDEERNQLASKLDNELDQFLDNLALQKKDKEKDKPKKEFNYDEWEKEISKHPAFMTKLPEDGDSEYNEYIEAIRSMKYDTGDTPEEIILDAEQHKKNGNKNFKLKKYRWAIDEYTNGIKLKPNDLKLMSQLYGNRAAANYELKNYRSAQRDCVWSLRLDPTNYKCILRMTRSYLNVNKVREGDEWLTKNLEYLKGMDIEHNYPNKWEEDCLSLKKEIAEKLVIFERNERKERLEKKKKLLENERYFKAFLDRKLNFFSPSINYKDPENFELDSLNVNIAQLKEKERVCFDKDGKTLIWPILFQYPEVGLIDFVKHAGEDKPLETFFDTLSTSWAEFTPLKSYLAGDNIVAYECGKKSGYIRTVCLKTLVSQILSDEEFFIKGGLPVFQVYTNKYFKNKFIDKGNCYYKPK